MFVEMRGESAGRRPKCEQVYNVKRRVKAEADVVDEVETKTKQGRKERRTLESENSK